MSGTDKKRRNVIQDAQPTRPGLTLIEDVLKALGLKVSKASEQFGISLTAFSSAIHDQAGMSL